MLLSSQLETCATVRASIGAFSVASTIEMERFQEFARAVAAPSRCAPGLLLKGFEMTTTSGLWQKLWHLTQTLHRDCEGQDFIEYALITGFICTVVITLSPAVSESFIT